jgi:hypothetical protein
MNTSLFVPTLNAMMRHPEASEYWIWYKGEKVREIGNLKSTHILGCQRCVEFPPKTKPTGARAWMYDYERIPTVRETTLKDVRSDGHVSDFQIGTEEDRQPVNFECVFTDEQTASAYKIFQDVFSGSWKNLGQWIYVTTFPRILKKAEYRRWFYQSPKVLKISYTPDHVSVDSEGEPYDDDNAPNFKNNHVFLADGRIFDIYDRYLPPYDVPSGLKLEDVQMAGIPLIWWILMFAPKEFVDTTTLPMAFKKMVKDQAESHPDTKYLSRNIWWMNGDEMLKVEITNKWVRLNGAKLDNEEIQNLMDTKENLWVGKYSVIRRLFANRPLPPTSGTRDVSDDSTSETDE